MNETSLAHEVEALLTGHSLIEVEGDHVLLRVSLQPYRVLLAAYAAQEVARVFARMGVPSKHVGAITERAIVAVGEWLASGPDEFRGTLAEKVKGLLAETGPRTLDELTTIALEREWLLPGMTRYELKHRIRNAVARRSDLFSREGGAVSLTKRGKERSKPKQARPAPIPAEAPAPVAAPERPDPERTGTAQLARVAAPLRPVPKHPVGGPAAPREFATVGYRNGRHACPKRPDGGLHVWVDQSPDPRKVGCCRHCGEPKAA
jgi:hypothetical protein